MTMYQGMKNIALSAIDTTETTAYSLIDGGVDPKEAIKAAAILTRSAVVEILDQRFKDRSASAITREIKAQSQKPSLN